MSQGQWWAEVGQWEEEQRLAATDDSGKDAVKDSAQRKTNEQKQPDRDEQQPVHAVV